jgi:hypothetical protein
MPAIPEDVFLMVDLTGSAASGVATLMLHTMMAGSRLPLGLQELIGAITVILEIHLEAMVFCDQRVLQLQLSYQHE